MKSLDLTEVQNAYIASFLHSLDCPRSLAVWLLYHYNEHEQLVALEFNPFHYNGIDAARDSLAATEFLSKATFLSLNRDKKELAIEKFFASEAVCRSFNHSIRRSQFKQTETASILLIASRKIASMLGEIDPEELVEMAGWGPGASTSIKRRDATHPKKFDLEDQISQEAYDFVKPWFSVCYPTWVPNFKPGGGAKIVTVPKNAKIDRTIAIEPGFNLWFQKGIGQLIRARLRCSGIDLVHGQRHNQNLCRIASKYGDLATVDFSSASDSISIAIVEALLPPRWFTLLDVFRSKFATLGSRVCYFEKFSSMGNGFTFELETLIFFAIAWACCQYENVEGSISVYGDDVILPSKSFDLYRAVCADVGFTVNPKKSYSSGPYRESCGSHYLYGIDSKPIYQKEVLDGRTTLLKAANSIRRLAHRRNTYGCDWRLRGTWQLLSNILGVKTPRVSEGFGDVGLIENIDGPHVSWQRHPHGHEGYLVRAWIVLAVKVELDSHGLLLFKLQKRSDDISWDKIHDLSTLCDGNEIPLPMRVKPARKRLLFPRWYELGPWI